MKTLIFILLVLTTVSCRELDIPNNPPKCVTGKINAFKDEACEKGANVKKYTFQEKTVYVFDPGTCGADMTSEVIDSECNNLGYLGGITGNTTINGESFENAEFVETTWTK